MKNGTNSFANMKSTKFLLMDGREKRSQSKCKGKADCEFASSLDVNHGHGSKASNVVAKLMGLDSLPELTCSPISSPTLVKETRAQRRTNNFQIERCLSENLPPKSAKLISVPKHRNLCPAKAPGSSSVPLQIQNLKPKLEASSKLHGFLAPSETPKCPRSYKYAKGQPREMVKAGLGVPLASRTSDSSSSVNLDYNKTNSNEGKSVSLAIQAMINVRQRARLSSNGASDGEKLDQLNESQVNIHEGAQRPPLSVCKNRDVLGPNYQKQNCIANKDNVGSVSLSKQKDQKVPNLRHALKKNSSVTSPHAKVSPRKPQLSRQVIARKDTIRKSEISVKRRNGSAEVDINWDAINRRNKMDIISFTFSSPIKKTKDGSVFINQVVENVDLNESGDSTSDTSGSNLSAMLEQKLDELSSRVKTPHFMMFEAQNNSSLSGLQDSPITIFKQQEYEETEKNSCESMDGELAGGYPSPVSCLDRPSFSDGSCDSSNNKTTESSSHDSEEIEEPIDPRPSQTNEVDLELSDSASSSYSPFATNKNDNWELEYIGKILDYAKLNLEDLVLNKGRRLIRPELFFQLENQEIETDLDKLFQRKVWFDCVGECLEEKANLLSHGSSKGWSKWATLFDNNLSLAQDLHREISGWICLGDLYTDDFVDKDMSSWTGKWISYEMESFEVQLEIERRILSSLVTQLAADLNHSNFIRFLGIGSNSK